MAVKKTAPKTASEIIKGGFSLDNFKKNKGFSNTSVKFKTQDWIKVSDAFTEVTSLKGIPMGHITLLRGHSDTGKTTLLLEAAVNAQKQGILPVFIITEMKWSWPHAQMMGLEVEEVVDEDTGEITDYKGFFLYADRGTLNTIEDVAVYILDLIDEQKKGNLPYDLLFLWDSVGSVPCELSIKSMKNNNEWNGGAMSTQFGNNVNQKIMLSRKEASKYTNTLVAVNKVWTAKPEHPMGQPRLENKGGKTMWYDATVIITFGNITNSGTSKIKAINKGKEFEFAKRTKVQIDKNHIDGVQSRGPVIMTSHGFIPDDKKAIDAYKDAHKHEWIKALGSEDFQITIEADVEEERLPDIEIID
jgi:RecA/RadA recombinase